MKSLLICILALILIFTPGCRKDPQLPEVVVQNEDTLPNEENSICGGECFDFPPSPEIGWQFTSTGVQYRTPCFNPNDSNEFVFLRVGTASVAELVKFNMINKTETVLCNSLNIASPPKWSRTGWITFGTLQKKIWKIKDDGTELTQLTNGINDRVPIFNFNGDAIVYFRDQSYSNSELSSNPDLYKEYKMMIIDLNGFAIDSVTAGNTLPGNYYQKWEFGVFNQEENVYFVGGSGPSAGFYTFYSTFDSINPNKIVSLYPYNGWIMGLDYHTGYLYYSKFRSGIYRTDIYSGIQEKIWIGCETVTYENLSMSPSGKKILIEKVISTAINEYEISEKREIWILDADGCGEERILGQ